VCVTAVSNIYDKVVKITPQTHVPSCPTIVKTQTYSLTCSEIIKLDNYLEFLNQNGGCKMEDVILRNENAVSGIIL
jgi:hypothetical protein